jgi:hypothetical protein
MTEQIKSKQRVTDHGEVFTSEREVNAMLDLVKQETERIDSRFLEPACGTGNFLVEILRRKLDVVENRYKQNQLDYERYSVIAVSSIYGVELLTDNAEACRERLLNIFVERYTNLYKSEIKEECIRSIRYILRRNIVVGDALTLKTVDDKEEPIVFSEWSSVNGSMVKRRDYTLANLLANQPMDEPNLFSDLGDRAFLPTPVKDYPLIHFLKIGEEDG